MRLMIKRIEQINNLGRFENFSTTSEFGNNTIIFGFNGAGKSTLSDIFYSLSKDNTDDYLGRRRTLNREGEFGEKTIDIRISSDEGLQYIFSGDSWNCRPQKLFVFNEKYIEEHVFVSKQVEGNVVPIAMGTQGVSLLRQKENLENINNELLARINSDIGLLTESGLKIKDFSNTKVSGKTAIKRFNSMATFPLYPVSNETAIREKLRKNEVYSQEIEICERCDELYVSIKNVELISITNVFKKIERIPRISSRELAKFLENSLTSVDLKWAVRGYQNQKDKEICPMCGQEIVDKQAIIFFRKLGKYISQGKNGQLLGFSKELSSIASQLSNIRISERIANFVKIVDELDSANLLLKKDVNRLQRGLSWRDVHSQHIDTLISKIYEKAENPYLDIDISEDEKASLKLLNAVISNIIVLGDILEVVKSRIEEKNARNFVKEEVGKICELSYGASGSYRIVAERIKSDAGAYIRNAEKIEKLSIEITDCYNQNRLSIVNEFLQKLNTQIKIEVKNGHHYIKLKDFQAKELEKKDSIFSEGENRAIAFAYYLAEISFAENGNESRTIVIDDPISSMDLSRKSIISHRVAEMMNVENWQIILMTHDISFVERVVSYLNSNITCNLLEIRSNKSDFLPLRMQEYLTDDRQVYEKFIGDALNSTEEIDRIMALMALRPYSFVLGADAENYKKIEKTSTYFAHTLYSKNKSISFKSKNYTNKKLVSYVRLVNRATGRKINPVDLVGDYSFTGFDFDKLTNLYNSIPLDSVENMRKKVMLMRPLIEACFFQLSSRDKFDPEHIGAMYAKTIKANKSNELRSRMCLELKELYDASKKYHHGADEGSLLGIAWVNPNEVEYFDIRIQEIVSVITREGILREIPA